MKLNYWRIEGNIRRGHSRPNSRPPGGRRVRLSNGVPSPWLPGFLFVLLAVVFLSTTAKAQVAASDWVDYGQGRVRLVSATTGTTGEDILLGLHYDIDPGW